MHGQQNIKITLVSLLRDRKINKKLFY